MSSLKKLTDFLEDFGEYLTTLYGLTTEEVTSVKKCILTTYKSLNSLKKDLKTKKVICKDDKGNDMEMDSAITSLMTIFISSQKGGGLSLGECMKMKITDIKKTDFYKNLPRNANKTKLKKEDLCKLIEQETIDKLSGKKEVKEVKKESKKKSSKKKTQSKKKESKKKSSKKKPSKKKSSKKKSSSKKPSAKAPLPSNLRQSPLTPKPEMVVIDVKSTPKKVSEDKEIKFALDDFNKEVNSYVKDVESMEYKVVSERVPSVEQLTTAAKQEMNVDDQLDYLRRRIKTALQLLE